MAEQSLSFYEVEKLLRSTSTSAETPQSKPRSWLSASDIRNVLVAIEHDADQVYIIGRGRMFNIKYVDDKVWLSPADGTFAPCGWFWPPDLKRDLDATHVIAV